MTVGQLVARNARRLRHERGLSLGELARRSRLAKQTIASVEAASGNPTVETLDRLADGLGVSVRALLTEFGSELSMTSERDARWTRTGGVDVRRLDQVFGSGYVTNVVLRLTAARGATRHKPMSRGALRHCYVIDGRLRLGLEPDPAIAERGDFIRFPADAVHVFEALTPTATLVVCTTAPQVSTTRVELGF
ncbi:MAG: helix-turn-helix domain-containing protein [Leifsonia sp.]|uniref:helix-turn-helix domain-containing protein n=1 Tax=Leifsonia sp. TaxID=1870902 RepID=UPI003F808F98